MKRLGDLEPPWRRFHKCLDLDCNIILPCESVACGVMLMLLESLSQACLQNLPQVFNWFEIL